MRRLALLLLASCSGGVGSGAEAIVVPLPSSLDLQAAVALNHTDVYFHDLGDVMVTGGRVCSAFGCSGVKGTIAFYSATAEWRALASMTYGRYAHTATLLNDFSVLVIGGIGAPGSVERYDPSAAQPAWSPRAPLPAPRSSHTATLLADDSVLVVAGLRCSGSLCILLGDAQRYDTIADVWTPAGTLATRRYEHTATRLADGRVLVAGGTRGGTDSLAGVEIYDPATGAWTATASMKRSRRGHTASLLADGKVLVTGGRDCTQPITQPTCITTTAAEIYDPATAQWTLTTSMIASRSYHTATPLPTCRVVVAGGDGSGTTEIYDVRHRAWASGPALVTPRAHHTATPLGDESVLLASGTTSETVGQCGASLCGLAVATCSCPSDCVDSDGDGLSDVWETQGIDLDCDGKPDLDLRALGASPLHKDVFLEIDYMEGLDEGTVYSHRPSPEVAQMLTDAFAHAPVANPDGTTGVRLHVFVDQAIPLRHMISFGSCSITHDFADLDAIKARWLAPARLPAFHYAVFAHHGCELDDTSEKDLNLHAWGESPGSDFWIAGCSGASCALTVEQQARYIMHELGHNLGLSHAGDPYVFTSRHPNYYSVMGSLRSQGLDYSRVRLPSLDENALDESLGVQAGPEATRYWCPPVNGTREERDPPGDGPIDWNCNDVIDGAPVKADINGDDAFTVLNGWDDWATLDYPFQCRQNLRRPTSGASL